MRRLRSCFILVFSTFCLLIVVSYFALQTSYGAKILSQQLSKLGPYSISIGKINHSLANFYELSVDDVLIINDKQEVTKIGKLVIGFDKKNLWQLHHFNYIKVIDGEFNSAEITSFDFSANMLKFYNSAINFSLNDGQDTLSLARVYGRIKPFDLAGKNPYQFDLTLHQALFNQISINKILVQGYYRDGVTSVTNLGGNVDNGFFVSKLKVLADGRLDIEQLILNNMHFQTNDDSCLSKYVSKLPKFALQELSILDSDIQLPNLMIAKGNAKITNLSYDNQWNLNKTSFVFNANSVAWFDQLYSSVLLQLSFKDNEVNIQKAVAGWDNGTVHLAGSWKNSALHLNKLLLAGVNYELSDDSKQPLLPSIFNRVDVEQLTILQSMLTSIKSDYPFNIVNFDASGTNISLVENNKFGLYSGSLFLKAEDASVNQVGVRYPNLSVNVDAQHRTLLNFNALVDGGVIESTATIDPLQSEFESLHIVSQGVTSKLLNRWKLVQNPPESLNYRADLYGKISPYRLSGTFLTNNNDYSIYSQD
jgi:hypothetical protein